jgi:hypothetical protein
MFDETLAERISSLEHDIGSLLKEETFDQVMRVLYARFASLYTLIQTGEQREHEREEGAAADFEALRSIVKDLKREFDSRQRTIGRIEQMAEDMHERMGEIESHLADQDENLRSIAHGLNMIMARFSEKPGLTEHL